MENEDEHEYQIREDKREILGWFKVKNEDDFIHFTSTDPGSEDITIPIDKVVASLAGDSLIFFKPPEDKQKFIESLKLEDEIKLHKKKIEDEIKLHKEKIEGDIVIFKEIVSEIDNRTLLESIRKSFDKASKPTCIYLYRGDNEEMLTYDAKTDYITPEIYKKLIIIHSLYKKDAPIKFAAFKSKFIRSHNTVTCHKYSQLLKSSIVARAIDKAKAEAILKVGKRYEIKKQGGVNLGEFIEYYIDGVKNGVPIGFYTFETQRIYDDDYNNYNNYTVLEKLQIEENVAGGKMRSRKARRKRRRTLKKHRKTKSRK